VKRIRLPKGHIRYLEHAEVDQLLAVCREYRGGLCLAPVAAALYAGLRRGEVRWLDWADIDFERRTIAVRAKDGWRPKDNEDRVIPLHGGLAEVLGVVRPEKATGPAFCYREGARAGRRFGDDFLKRNLWNILEEAVLVDVDWNCLRHTFASHLVMAGVSIFKVSKSSATRRFGRRSVTTPTWRLRITLRILRGSGSSRALPT